MTALREVREGVSRAWDSLAAGWRELRQRAAHALTHFQPLEKRGTFETRAERQARYGSRWGLLAADVCDDDRQVEVTLEAPGLEPDDFRIEVFGDRLYVRGEKRLERESKHGRFQVMERAYGRFERVIPLPAAVDDSQASASYRRGVLRIVLPKLHAGSTRRVKVERA